LNIFKLDIFKNFNYWKLDNFFLKIYYFNFYSKKLNFYSKKLNFFKNFKIINIKINKFIYFKQFSNFFNLKINFYLKWFYFNFVYLFNMFYIFNFNTYFFIEKKLNKKILCLNLFNKSLFNYFFNNFYSLIFFKNIHILNFFKLGFLINYSEHFSHNIVSYNNLYPIFSNETKNFKTKFVNKFKFSFDKFFNIFILNFYEKMFKSFFFIKLNLNKNLKTFYKNYYKSYPFSMLDNQQDNYTIDEMFEIFCFSFINRDITILNNWIVNKMNKINFRNHKKFLNVIQHFLFHYRYFFIFILNIEGFFLKVRGKLSVAGNAKKKVFFYKIGKVNLSKKN